MLKKLVLTLISILVFLMLMAAIIVIMHALARFADLVGLAATYSWSEALWRAEVKRAAYYVLAGGVAAGLAGIPLLLWVIKQWRKLVKSEFSTSGQCQ